MKAARQVPISACTVALSAGLRKILGLTLASVGSRTVTDYWCPSWNNRVESGGLSAFILHVHSVSGDVSQSRDHVLPSGNSPTQLALYRAEAWCFLTKDNKYLFHCKSNSHMIVFLISKVSFR